MSVLRPVLLRPRIGVLGVSNISRAFTANTVRAFSTGAVRKFETQSTTPPAANELLTKQRLNRPISPDLAIYQPQITWVLSGAHRITGVALGVGFYLYLIGAAVGPAVGLTVDSASLSSLVASLPVAVKFLGKFLISLPLTFHSFNGIRHLIWDFAKELTLPGVYRTGYTVLGLALVSSFGLAIM
ncbi:hypothetical protein CANCADRAFT_31811 [Tortispora caseinolytica NRRL Y-17796]|uniref:Uncharacterized protein n=1 Tax=Tortispora caseinolytica NRRL Y-17796 TaxID=767744 RepID=A0A1E4TGX9_9ASCO|nr:hypothetical protein CANCADRAFT_31811 [Tortispora caseinolytica NRRL Y-17796]